ncbi:MAG TPA: DUF4397 domain-containing protein [Gemmatimonadales bacterium]|nr:DUF4397 domain-containing protein [Gemmatimonadales bacterium]
MRVLRLVSLAAIAASLTACERGTEGTPFEPDPLAAVRFINAVPDTMAMDYRFVDFVTNAGMYDATFRTNQAHYQPVLAGQHTIRVFLSSTDVTVAPTVVNETNFTFVEGKNYTFLHAGFMRAGQSPAVSVNVVEDSPPTPTAGRIALRAVNLAAGLGAMDVFVGTATSGLPSATARWSNVAFGAFTPYVELDTAAYRVAATASGTTTPLVVANTAAPAGSAATGTSSAITGVRISGSALTIVLLPRSVAGSPAPQTSAYTSPAFVFLNDRRPQ